MNHQLLALVEFCHGQASELKKERKTNTLYIRGKFTCTRKSQVFLIQNHLMQKHAVKDSQKHRAKTN